MAQTTLYEALNAYNEQYLDALSSNSLRQIAILEQGWQQINNYWDLYIQAKAEGKSTAADSAIGGITDILGGNIDVSVLPNIGGIISERDGSVVVTAVTTKITFASDLGTTDYRLLINLHDVSGVPLGYVLGALETDGFTITPSFPGRLIYNAKIL